MDIGQPSSNVESSDVDALDRDLGWAIGVVSRSYRRLAMAAVEQLPAGPRGYHLLCAVADGPPRSQLALARRLGIDKTVMTYLVDDLEKAGMVVRRPDPLDRRARQVTITANGFRALQRAREQVQDAESELLANLTAEAADVLRSVMARLARDAQEVAVQSGESAAPSC
ncbi:MarR family transcriptional regulator [Modestobacter sp. VKM Ac-2979]|uniref:MarR family winged helix-turn-helix transcriptional regulator n=1 Tax=unclassified Modestobacter TaxID=2643866 RepID=UPI0022ABBA4B|nr:MULTISPECIES: MarR family transcriptional regulator [unclassified Modestobacter]MCZ2811941.1 MarR family transcriptional regulator [Modestobacter sp. VKM Ac-2979]MCZ2843664.1 MarR family transcriptional regulator [Modestobacter sp. VKM Ac-2980]